MAFICWQDFLSTVNVSKTISPLLRSTWLVNWECVPSACFVDACWYASLHAIAAASGWPGAAELVAGGSGGRLGRGGVGPRLGRHRAGRAAGGAGGEREAGGGGAGEAERGRRREEPAAGGGDAPLRRARDAGDRPAGRPGAHADGAGGGATRPARRHRTGRQNRDTSRDDRGGTIPEITMRCVSRYLSHDTIRITILRWCSD